MDATIDLSEYRITEEIYFSSRTLIHRWIRESDRQSIVVKTLSNEYPSFHELVQFHNQYSITRNLNFPNIISTYEIKRYHNGYALIMEDFGGISLKQWTQELSAIPLRDFLQIAIDLCATLDILYQERIIHKDIKPANILINPATKQVKLIDFSIASLLPRETQEIQNANSLEGTLAYLSPEQTGRMNRGIDYRSDFYALGVTFYELLIGRLPFISSDPIELVHSHLAKTPTPVHEINLTIPLVLSRIVGKLMAKNAEDRYQSALGIKHDLELCLEQLQAIGQIESFEIGQRDISDRFIIPEKLYGREAEVKSLLDGFDRVTTGNTEMILVAGFSGIGKTAVVNEVHKPITKQRGYFIKGKFDQFQRNIPFSAFVQAFRNLIRQLLSESDSQLNNWQTKILEVVGKNGQVLIEVIPELEYIIGKQAPAPELSGSAAQNRFNLLFQKFVQIFTHKEHPLVIFIDDLQWADSASLNLLQLLMQDTGHLLILGAYRDNEVSLVHPFILTVDEIIKTGAVVNTIHLQTLNREQLNQLVADTLKRKSFLTQPLTDLIHQKTKGNPFFATQFLKALHEDKQIIFDLESRSWQYDIFRIRSLTLTDDVVEFMAFQLRRLSQETQDVLKLAACIGAQFDLQTLAIIYESSAEDTARALRGTLLEGLIIPNTESYKFFMQLDSMSIAETDVNPTYRFLHDRIQQAAYSLIPDHQKQSTHYQIGQLLLQKVSPTAKEERIFEIVNQLNYGTDLINQQSQRDELARLNLIAGRKARSATAYQAAREYARVGLLMLGETAWETQYEMTLSCYELAAEVAWFCGDFEQMEQLIESVLWATQTPLEKVKVYQIKIDALTSQNNFPEAIATGKTVLNLLGVGLPDSPTPKDAQQAVQEIMVAIGDRPVEDLFHLPKMVDAQQMAILKIAATLITPCYGANSPYLFLVAALQVNRSIQFGNSPISALGYTVYGVLLSMLFRNIELADQFGQLAHRLVLESEAKSNRTPVFCGLGILRHRICHIRETLPLFQEGYRVGVETGAMEYVGQNGSMFTWYTFWAGQNLAEIAPEIEAYQQQLLNFNQVTQSDYCLICSESVLMLLDRPESDGIAARQEEMVAQKLAINDLVWMFKFSLHRFTTSFILGNIALAEDQAAQTRNYLQVGAGNIGEIIFYFYDSLTALATVAVNSDKLEAQQQRVQNNQTQLEFFARHAPMNYQHKFDLVEAEKCRVTGNNYEAGEWYDRAILGAKKNQYTQEEALANELAARFYVNWGQEKTAASYMQDAYYCYSRWGAKAKIEDLEAHYPQLLEPILKPAKTNFDPVENLINITQTLTRNRTSSTNITDSLDFVSILKAAQTISGEIKLDELIRQLTQIILQNSGADKCVLVFLQDETWQVRAISTPETTELNSTPIDDYPNIPLRLIQYIKRTNTVIIVNNLETDLPIIGDYLIQHQPKSIVGLPILHQGHLIGVVYLENQATAGVFNSDRLTVINFLCTQAAISLTNAQLYQNLQCSEANEHEKTKELEQTLTVLQLQNKKLAFRADVDAGLTQNDSLAEMLQSATESIVQHLEAAFARIWTLNPDENVLELQASAGQYTHLDGLHARVPVGKFKIGLIAEECRPHLTNDVLNDPRVGDKEWAKQEGMIAFAGYPLVVENQIMGVIAMFARHPLNDEILGLLSSVADEIASAIKRKHIQKALQESEIELRQKSQQIAQAFQQLQQTQLQIVQSEKMSALGNLVAGVAHEINNPIGFLSGNIHPALDYINDLFGLIDLVQQKYPQLHPEIQAEIETIDLEYIREDLPKLIDSMKEGVNRIRDISTSLRTFSRADSDRPIACNIHDGIDSTIMILKHRLKANESRPEIAVIKSYGNLPKIECYAGQLNQVFMNILANAIDALDESNQNRTFADIKANPNCITITTSVENNQAKIAIADNGKGMSEEVTARVFDHLFTTKEVGKGTGLGLAIAQQIIVEKHGGAIAINSTLGQGTEFVISLPIKSN